MQKKAIANLITSKTTGAMQRAAFVAMPQASFHSSKPANVEVRLKGEYIRDY